MITRSLPAWALLSSVGFHVLLFFLLFQVPMHDRGHRPQLRTIRFRMAPGLVKARPTAPKAPVRPAPAVVKPTPKPAENKKASPVTKPKPIQQDSRAAIPTPHPVPEKEAQPAPQEETSVGATVSFFDAPSFPFDYYVQQFLNRVSANWYKPPVQDGLSVVIHFVIKRNGRVHDIRIEEPSGISAFDRAAMRAVYASNPLPPLPYDFKEDSLGVHLRFE